MARYTSLTIIYNPNSTGASKKLATALRTDLRVAGYTDAITLAPTKYAGHAEKMAYKLAGATKRPLIISSSGDGGYHEVVNGLLKAQAEGARPTAGLLPAGNANDHHANVHKKDVVRDIMRGHEQQLDVLKFEGVSDGKSVSRYAHSYIGIGLTPKIGKELNATNLNRWKEAWIVARVLLSLQPVQLKVEGKTYTYDSLIFSNVQRMSKILTLSSTAKPDDGKFEVTAFRKHTKRKLILSLLRASTKGLDGSEQTTSYAFETLKRALVQLDGEILTVDARSEVRVTLENALLRCVV